MLAPHTCTFVRAPLFRVLIIILLKRFILSGPLNPPWPTDERSSLCMHTAHLNCMNSLSRCDLAVEGCLETQFECSIYLRKTRLGEAEVFVFFKELIICF